MTFDRDLMGKMNPETMNETRTGTIQRYDFSRGFGFVRPHGGDSDLFFHISACRPAGFEPCAGNVVSFEVEQAPDGRSRAINVVRA
jgi:cold shock protein